ncbi:MAG: hypothetical protein Q9211_004313 [Gyalolechia sp. 1 TL-2023]
MYVRTRRHTTGWDDYTICIALALSLLGTVANVYQVANGTGRHIETLTTEQLSEFIKWTFVEGVAFVISTCFVKVSVCIFILRLIDKTRRNMRHFIYVLMGFLIVSTLGLTTQGPLCSRYERKVLFEICINRSRIRAGRYIPPLHAQYNVPDNCLAINVFTDFTCAGLPFFVIRRLQMKPSLKIGLSIIMGLGVL